MNHRACKICLKYAVRKFYMVMQGELQKELKYFQLSISNFQIQHKKIVNNYSKYHKRRTLKIC
jgi:hypothetical protein